MWNIEEECKVVPDKDICTDTLAEKKEREKVFEPRDLTLGSWDDS